MFDSVSAKVTRLDSSTFLFVGLLEYYVFSGQIQSLSHEEERIERVIVPESSENLKKWGEISIPKLTVFEEQMVDTSTYE